MEYKKLLSAMLLGAPLCFMAGAGYGEIEGNNHG